MDFAIPETPGCGACQHQSIIGCKIYPDRPAECREFECAYVRHGLGMPPQRSGLVIYEQASEEYGRILVFRETRDSRYPIEMQVQMVYRRLPSKPALAKTIGAFVVERRGEPPETIPVFWEDDDA
jgi:hypothetical protein